MSRSTPVDQIMTTDVVSFTPSQNVQDATNVLMDRGIDGGPVVDDQGVVVGVLSSADLIVQDTRLHIPTMISIFGATLELPSAQRHLEHDLEKALALTVDKVMDDTPITIGPSDTVESAATLMHDNNITRLPVVDGSGTLVGLVARGDILRSIVEDSAPAASGDGGGG